MELRWISRSPQKRLSNLHDYGFQIFSIPSSMSHDIPSTVNVRNLISELLVKNLSHQYLLPWMVSGHLYQEGDGKAGDDVTPPRVCCYLFCPPHYHQHHACHQLIEIKIILIQLHIPISPPSFSSTMTPTWLKAMPGRAEERAAPREDHRPEIYISRERQ